METIGLLAFALGIGAATGVLARTKGYDPALGFVAGFFLSLIGLLI